MFRFARRIGALESCHTDKGGHEVLLSHVGITTQHPTTLIHSRGHDDRTRNISGESVAITHSPVFDSKAT